MWLPSDRSSSAWPPRRSWPCLMSGRTTGWEGLYSRTMQSTIVFLMDDYPLATARWPPRPAPRPHRPCRGRGGRAGRRRAGRRGGVDGGTVGRWGRRRPRRGCLRPLLSSSFAVAPAAIMCYSRTSTRPARAPRPRIKEGARYRPTTRRLVSDQHIWCWVTEASL